MQPTSPCHATLLALDLVRDRKRDLVLLDVGIENLVVEERGRLWFEKHAGSLSPVVIGLAEGTSRMD